MGIELFQSYAYDVFGVKLTEVECKEYKRIYYNQHPAIARYHRDMGKKVKGSNFTVQTALGRVVKPDRYADALNIPVQGTIAECTKMAINYIYEDYADLMTRVKLINMVHDSLVIDTPDEYIEEVSKAMTTCMKEAWRQISLSPLFSYHNLPMGVDIDVGKVWK
jgi:DNA polymerase I-like protein with 3'-5' exonuclease and polymerase domains